ncbi:zinc finger protein 668 [Amphiprion ocellaris]|uniref:zinc finger protein 668 n=1 Tax=Amphiprion ocellaris TaxID=80972 RepID=UPI00241190C8|nr:zinc finger protein 668 [Amphiprion ocellaris]
MSIEYTIDIQLTELGFPDILQPQEASDRQTPCHPTSPGDSPSHSPTSLSTTHKQRHLIRDEKEASTAKLTSNSQQNTVVYVSSPLAETLPDKQVNPAQNPQNEPAVNGTERPEMTVDDPPAGADSPQLITDEHGGDAATEGLAEGQLDVDDDSDDSEVSDLYEEEEADEEDDEEEDGISNESGHSGDYRCSICDLQLPSQFKLQDHMNLHTGARPYCCAECGKRFCQIYNYRVHLRTHALVKVDRPQCRICMVSFPAQVDLNRHLSRTHLENEFYECDLCKRVFTSLKACENHVQLHKCMLNVVCDVCGRNFSSPKSLARHRKKSCHRNFKCTDCTKTFTKKNALLKHSFSHLGLLPYTCIRCRRHFRLAKLYRQHKCEPERIHCVACLREFLSQEDFQQHKKDTGCWGNQDRNVTPDEIRCLECGQRFDTSEELKKHAGAHQRVLKCAECGKGFRSALLLMSHMGGHAGKSPCLCQSCGFGFPHQQNYDSHLKTCGQTPPSQSAPKKRQTSKSSLPDTKKPSAKPDSSTAATTATAPAVVSASPATPVQDCSSPGLVTAGVSAGSAPSDRLWKLTLNKQPPPGVELVVFVPVCPTQTNGLPLSSAIPQTLPVTAMQALPQASSPLLPGNLGVNAALGAPLDLVTGIKQDPEAPLDLSKKRSSSESAPTNIPLPPVKSEPEEREISGQINGTERHEFKKRTTKTEEKMASSGPIMDIKSEPQSPGLGLDLCLSRTRRLTDSKLDKEIKMEVEISNPPCADMET